MAAEEQEGGRGFRVQDRRRFSPVTGERSSGEEENEHPTQTPGKENPASSASSRQATTGSHGPPEPISFSSFILGLSTQTLMFMGEIPLAPGQPPQIDLAAAQQM